jgi:hypothetical protein
VGDWQPSLCHLFCLELYLSFLVKSEGLNCRGRLASFSHSVTSICFKETVDGIIAVGGFLRRVDGGRSAEAAGNPEFTGISSG